MLSNPTREECWCAIVTSERLQVHIDSISRTWKFQWLETFQNCPNIFKNALPSRFALFQGATAFFFVLKFSEPRKICAMRSARSSRHLVLLRCTRLLRRTSSACSWQIAMQTHGKNIFFERHWTEGILKTSQQGNVFGWLFGQTSLELVSFFLNLRDVIGIYRLAHVMAL